MKGQYKMSHPINDIILEMLAETSKSQEELLKKFERIPEYGQSKRIPASEDKDS